MKKILGLLIVAVAVAFSIVPAIAQEPPPQPEPSQPRTPKPPHDPFGPMFPPEIVMQNQRELGLTDQQKAYMRTEIGKTSARFNDLQWQLHDAMEVLHETMKATQVNEQQALAQLDRVLGFEREVKRLHMELAIKIKNNLTPEQQQKLQSLRRTREPGAPGMGPGHGPGDGPHVRRPGGPGMGPGGGPPRPPRPNF
ncbi:MAG TPA: periplasmic heavy metal sensor [Pyrinomonadaceae bacterium]|nr:periplasmic heavy metal sensor [Pyrinomonadaceae bacterium]